MGARDFASALESREPYVLDLMAGRAEGDHTDEPLDARSLVVFPYLVALNGVFAAASVANLAAMTGALICLRPYSVPVLAGHLLADI
jgi:hypothetical protein